MAKTQKLAILSAKGLNADGIANSADLAQTAPLHAVVLSGSALFAQTYLSKYLEFL